MVAPFFSARIASAAVPIRHHFHGCKAPLARASHVKWRYTKYLALTFNLWEWKVNIFYFILFYYPRPPCRSARVGISRLFICLSPAAYLKNERSQSVQTWYMEWPWDILQVVYGFGLIGQRSRLGLGLTAIRRGFELYECLLVFCCLDWRINVMLSTRTQSAETYDMTGKGDDNAGINECNIFASDRLLDAGHDA